LSFSCRFLIQRGGRDPEPSWKVQKRDMFLSFSHPDPASGEGGKPGLGNAKKMQKMTPGLGNAKKSQKKMTPSLGNAKQMQKKMQRKCKKMIPVLVKLRFWSFQVGPASRP
jgi:hypothetical protein